MDLLSIVLLKEMAPEEKVVYNFLDSMFGGLTHEGKVIAATIITVVLLGGYFVAFIRAGLRGEFNEPPEVRARREDRKRNKRTIWKKFWSFWDTGRWA